jgi:hypothetical protein
MKVYHYDKETNEYIGETEARLDPLELKLNKIERWLLPAHATFDVPPESEEGKMIVMVDGQWTKIDKPMPPVEPIPTTEELRAIELETKIQTEMNRILREQAITSLKAKGEI